MRADVVLVAAPLGDGFGSVWASGGFVGFRSFAMQPTAVAASAECESGLAAQVEAGASAGAPALLAATPMGADADSVEFAAVLQALGTAYVAAAGEHGVSRELFSAAQSLAAVTTVVSEAARAAAMSL